MGQARSLPAGSELSGYYEAALAYVDPCLPMDASLDEITTAASRRQAELARRPLESVRTDLQELAQALLFVQRAHQQVKASQVCSLEPEPPQAPAVKFIFEAEHSPPVARPAAAGGARLPEARRNQTGAVVGSMALKPQPQPLAKMLELPQPAQAEPVGLPEDLAWPVARGLLLLAWQAWLAWTGGWAVARLLAWPAPGYGLELSWAALAGVVALGVIVGLGVLLIARAYRVATHRLGLLAHLSALALGMDMLAWWLAARRWPGLIEYPGWGWFAVLMLGWLAAWGLAAWHDARVTPPRKRGHERRRVA